MGGHLSIVLFNLRGYFVEKSQLKISFHHQHMEHGIISLKLMDS